MRLCVLVVLTVLTFKFVVVLVRVDGLSMAPTYRPKQIEVVNRLAFLFHEPQRGDVVAIRPVAGEHAGYYMKRIVGLPGETVAFHAGHLLINGRVLDEPYMKWPYAWEMAPVLVGLSEYYVVGDNRTMDRLGHSQGRTERAHIIGNVIK